MYINFLNTPYELKKTITIGTFSNFEANVRDKSFIVYCEPKIMEYKTILTFFENSVGSTFKDNLSFQNKRILGERVDLISIFNSLKIYINKGFTSFTPVDTISIQKYFYPYYDSLSKKTTYWNIITLSQFLTEMNIYYGDITHTNILELTTEEDEEINFIINYDLYCPYYEYPIRFVFQHIVKIPK